MTIKKGKNLCPKFAWIRCIGNFFFFFFFFLGGGGGERWTVPPCLLPRLICLWVSCDHSKLHTKLTMEMQRRVAMAMPAMSLRSHHLFWISLTSHFIESLAWHWRVAKDRQKIKDIVQHCGGSIKKIWTLMPDVLHDFLTSAAFSIHTSENNLISPYNQFKRQIEGQQWTITRRSYVHKPMQNSQGPPEYLINFFS